MRYLKEANDASACVRIAALCAACMLVLGVMLVSHGAAFAAESVTEEHAIAIGAEVQKPAPVVIKVEVPSSSSSVDIHIRTSVLDGRFLGFAAAKSSIKNLEESSVPISATVGGVSDGVQGAKRALDYVRVLLTGDRTVDLDEEVNARSVVVERLEPGSTCDLTVEVLDRNGDVSIPAGEYGMRATIKVSAA